MTNYVKTLVNLLVVSLCIVGLRFITLMYNKKITFTDGTTINHSYETVYSTGQNTKCAPNLGDMARYITDEGGIAEGQIEMMTRRYDYEADRYYTSYYLGGISRRVIYLDKEELIRNLGK